MSSAKWTMKQAPSEQRPQQPEAAPEAAQPQEQHDIWRHRSPVRPVRPMDPKQVWTDGVCHRTDARRRTRSLGDILDSDFDSDLYSEAVVRTGRPKSENDRDFPSIKSDYRRQRTPHTPQTLDYYRMRIHRMVARYPQLRPYDKYDDWPFVDSQYNWIDGKQIKMMKLVPETPVPQPTKPIPMPKTTDSHHDLLSINPIVL